VDDLITVYQRKRVLVTGDTGFKGSWLCLWASWLGAEVRGYALPPQRPEDHYNVIGLEKHIQHIDGNILDQPLLKDVMEKFQPEIVFHLAAQPLVRLSYDQPKLTFDTNITGSVNVLDAVQTTSSVRALIFVTSDKCYKDQDHIHGYAEDDELGGNDPYSASKAAAELVFASYSNSYFCKRPALGAASVRSGNVLGGGDWAADRILPDCIRSLEDGRNIQVRNPDSIRPWQHVLEPLGGYLLLAARLLAEPERYSGAWNFGPLESDMWPVRSLVKQVVSCWGSPASIVHEDRAHGELYESRFLRLNCMKARTLLSWTPRWDIYRTVQETVDWYRRFLAGAVPHDLTLSQIQAYMSCWGTSATKEGGRRAR